MAKISMREVAARAGVSVATVSHVINHTRNVKPDTADRVNRVIEELNYVPNVMARGFKTGRKYTIGFVVPNINDPFFSTLIAEAENVLSLKGYRLLISNTHESISRELENIGIFASGMVDGILVASTLHSYEELSQAVTTDIPMVFLDRVIADCPHDVVRVDCSAPMKEAVEDLIRQGHTHIAYLRNSPYLSTTVERLNAYESVMKAHGLTPDVIPLMNPTLTQLTPYLEQAMESGATALIAPNNITTQASIQYFYSRNRILGQDIELAAFQDVDEPNVLLAHAALVKQPVKELSRRSAEQLLERLEHPDAPVREIVLNAVYLPKDTH